MVSFWRKSLNKAVQVGLHQISSLAFRQLTVLFSWIGKNLLLLWAWLLCSFQSGCCEILKHFKYIFIFSIYVEVPLGKHFSNWAVCFQSELLSWVCVFLLQAPFLPFFLPSFIPSSLLSHNRHWMSSMCQESMSAYFLTVDLLEEIFFFSWQTKGTIKYVSLDRTADWFQCK